MDQSLVPGLKMLSPNRRGRERHNWNELLSYKRLEQQRQSDYVTVKAMRTLEGPRQTVVARTLEDLPLAVAVVDVDRTPMIATDAPTKTEALIQRIRLIGQTLTLERSRDFFALTMKLISALPFGSCVFDGSMPALCR